MLILWDWNGTLLDDVQYCIDVRNAAFPPLGLSRVDSLEQYYREFTFPVRQYYRNAGVSDEIFDTAAHAWIREYEAGFDRVPLYDDALETLSRFHRLGHMQTVLSATRLDYLRGQISRFPILPYFGEILGLGDIYAVSKADLGLNYMQRCGVSPNESVMIGDSLHDAEVARAMGTHCVLVSRGHQSNETLKKAGVPVVSSLTEAADLILSGRLTA